MTTYTLSFLFCSTIYLGFLLTLYLICRTQSQSSAHRSVCCSRCIRSAPTFSIALLLCCLFSWVLTFCGWGLPMKCSFKPSLYVHCHRMAMYCQDEWRGLALCCNLLFASLFLSMSKHLPLLMWNSLSSACQQQLWIMYTCVSTDVHEHTKMVKRF